MYNGRCTIEGVQWKGVGWKGVELKGVGWKGVELKGVKLKGVGWKGVGRQATEWVEDGGCEMESYRMELWKTEVCTMEGCRV